MSTPQNAVRDTAELIPPKRQIYGHFRVYAVLGPVASARAVSALLVGALLGLMVGGTASPRAGRTVVAAGMRQRRLLGGLQHVVVIRSCACALVGTPRALAAQTTERESV